MLSKFHDEFIFNFFNFKSLNINDFRNMPQTFLSYAYVDKGLTLGLFFYFLINHGFLYVNWMWFGSSSSAAHIKAELEKELEKSSQFLFLRTMNSELNIRSGGMVRQWCAWEIGNFYTKHKDEKFLTNFYDSPYTSSDLLNNFNSFKFVLNGRVY